jgi:hypothetical protein
MSTPPPLETVELPGFGIVPSQDQSGLSVAFNGTGDVAAIEALGAYLKQLHEVAGTLGVEEVVCDFRKLAFMNSSCFKAFVVWIDTVKNAPRPYRIRFLTAASMQWQKRSLEALRRLAAAIVTLDGTGSGQ